MRKPWHGTGIASEIHDTATKLALGYHELAIKAGGNAADAEFYAKRAQEGVLRHFAVLPLLKEQPARMTATEVRLRNQEANERMSRFLVYQCYHIAMRIALQDRCYV